MSEWTYDAPDRDESVFDAVRCDMSMWEEEVPLVEKPWDSAEIIPGTREHLQKHAGKSTADLVFMLSADRHKDLSDYLKRAFSAVEACAERIDEYCLSDAFDYVSWRCGDKEALDKMPQPVLDRDEWLRRALSDLHESAGYVHGAKEYRHEAMKEAAFWLACQYSKSSLHHAEAKEAIQKIFPAGFRGSHEVTEYALRRAYGDRIFPFHLLGRPDIRSVIDKFIEAVDRIEYAIRNAELSPATWVPPQATEMPAIHPSTRSGPPTLIPSSPLKNFHLLL
jgi:hypothetical protein